MSLCKTCRSIDPDFFSFAHDDLEIGQGPEISYASVNNIVKSARSGCPLCICMIAGADTDWLDRTVLEHIPVVLRRATIDSHVALAMYVGMDDVSHTYFFRVPSKWSATAPFNACRII
jgi:hypothetical protein